ncbi:MAG: O-antigen ligase family protein [Chitinophagales bacterium]
MLAIESIIVAAISSYALFFCFSFKRFFSTKQILFLLFIAWYVWICITGFWVTNIDCFLEAIRIKSVIIGLAFSFLYFDDFSNKSIRSFSVLVIAVLFLSSVFVLVHFHMNRDDILKNILIGSPIPVPMRSHIRYSILCNWALMLALYQSFYRSKLKSFSFFIWLFISFLMLLYLFFIAVKIGILIAFIILFCFAGFHIIHSKYSALKAFFSFLLLGTVAWLILLQFPTFQNKLAYIKYDLTRYQQRDTRNYSDGERIQSIQQGIKIIKSNPWIGVGEGNAKNHIEGIKDNDVKLPHNQFVLIWAQNGVIGITLFLLCFAIGFVSALRERNILLLCTVLSSLFACMVEPMLETQLGAAVFIMPWCLFSSKSYRTRS